METAHFEHHVAAGVVLHFRGGGGLHGNVSVWNVGEVRTDGVDDFVRTAMSALPVGIVLLFPVLQESNTHGGLVYGRKAVGTTHVHTVVNNFRNILDAGFNNTSHAIGCLDVCTHRHFELDAHHALVLSRGKFNSQVVLGEACHKEDGSAKSENLDNHARNRKAESKHLQVDKANTVQSLGEKSQQASDKARLFFDDVSIFVFLFTLEQVSGHKRCQRECHEERHERCKHHGHTECSKEDTDDGLHECDRHEHADVGERRCHDGNHDFRSALVGGFLRIKALIQLVVDVFKHDDGVRHQQTHGT